jgi:phage-related holin
MLDLHILGGGSALRTALIFWYIGNEGVSLLEIASVLGVPMPDILKQALIQIRNKGEKK